MQRVVIENYAYYGALETLDAKVSLIVKHFPPSVASLYALPKAGANNILEWWSPLGGQPILYASLDKSQQALLLQKYAQRQQSLQLLIDELEKRGQAEQASTLHSLLGEPDLNNLYSINQDPVLVRWGPQPPADPLAAIPQTAPVVPPTVLPHRRRLWSLLLIPLLLALVLLAWLAYWWWSSTRVDNYSCQPTGTTPPEFVTIFDTSGSMAINLQASSTDEQWLFEFGYDIPGGNDRTRKILASPTRMETAKNALTNMVNNLHPDIDVRLISFAGCHYQPDHGLFNVKQRPALLKRIRGLEADEGTPLAASLAYAASKVDGRTKDAVIVMFVDGVDGCDGNVCAVAETIARDQPRLKVNVVNIGNEPSESCITALTGGRTYDSTNAQAISKVLAKATQEVSTNANCDAIF